jgi:transposase
MSKRGSPVLRQSLWLAAVTARRFRPGFNKYYEAKVAEGKHPSVVTGAIARKLVHLIFLLWTEDRPFDPKYQWTAASPK